MSNLQYLITTVIYLTLGVLLIVITARTKPIKDLTHIWHLFSKKPDKALRKFLRIPADTVMVTRVNTLQQLLCMKNWSKFTECEQKCLAPNSSPTPSPKSHPLECTANCMKTTPSSPSPQCKKLHKDTSDMHEAEQFQNLQTCALTIGFILVFLSLFRFLTLLVN